jgi:hypothetical protein
VPEGRSGRTGVIMREHAAHVTSDTGYGRALRTLVPLRQSFASEHLTQ